MICCALDICGKNNILAMGIARGITRILFMFGAKELVLLNVYISFGILIGKVCAEMR